MSIPTTRVLLVTFICKEDMLVYYPITCFPYQQITGLCNSSYTQSRGCSRWWSPLEEARVYDEPLSARGTTI